MLQVSILLLLCAGALAQDRPVWTWQCQDSRCEKAELQESDNDPHSLEMCRLFCDPYLNLWPRPTGDIEVVREIVNINPYSVSVEHSSSQLKPKVEELIRGAGNIFQESILRTAKIVDKTGKRSIGESLFVKLLVNNYDEHRFNTDTDESYELFISQTKDGRMNATIRSETFFGARHGLETLGQLVVVDAGRQLALPRMVHLLDAPVYKHRGILLDTARSYISVPGILRVLNGMAANKLNTFHWHITDSHSFPFQSEKYPNFSRYGAYSPEKVYTSDDIRSIVLYARTRGVRVVPEFDEPAHVGEGWQWVGEDTTVCFKAEPWKSYCVEPPCGQLNPTSDKVYEILGELYKELVALFDSDIFHMGGDEVNINCWNTSSVITDWMTNNNMSRTEEGFMDFWEMFQKRAYSKLVEANNGVEMPVMLWTSGLTEKGRVDQHLEKEKYIIQIWTTGSDDVVSELVNKGYRVIFSNYDALYFDCGFGAWVGEGNNWCSPYISWQKVYANSPVQLLEKQGVSEEVARSLALGAEATLFTEQADDSALDGRLWPRAAAMAERLWTEPKDGWKSAEHRMLYQRERLVNRGIAADTLQPEWCLQNQGYCYA